MAVEDDLKALLGLGRAEDVCTVASQPSLTSHCANSAGHIGGSHSGSRAPARGVAIPRTRLRRAGAQSNPQPQVKRSAALPLGPGPAHPLGPEELEWYGQNAYVAFRLDVAISANLRPHVAWLARSQPRRAAVPAIRWLPTTPSAFDRRSPSAGSSAATVCREANRRGQSMACRVHRVFDRAGDGRPGRHAYGIIESSRHRS